MSDEDAPFSQTRDTQNFQEISGDSCDRAQICSSPSLPPLHSSFPLMNSSVFRFRSLLSDRRTSTPSKSGLHAEEQTLDLPPRILLEWFLTALDDDAHLDGTNRCSDFLWPVRVIHAASSRRADWDRLGFRGGWASILVRSRPLSTPSSLKFHFLGNNTATIARFSHHAVT